MKIIPTFDQLENRFVPHGVQHGHAIVVLRDLHHSPVPILANTVPSQARAEVVQSAAREKLQLKRQQTLLDAAAERTLFVRPVGRARIRRHDGYLRIEYKSGMLRSFFFAANGTLQGIIEKKAGSAHQKVWTRVSDAKDMQTWAVRFPVKKTIEQVNVRIRVSTDGTIKVTTPRGMQTVFEPNGSIHTMFVGRLDELLEVRPGVSESFIAAVECELERLPIDRREYLASIGFKMVLTRIMSEGDPEFATIVPRGYPAGSNINQARGLAQPWLNRVFVAEYYESGGVLRPTLPTLSGVVWHELGHELFDLVDAHTAQVAYDADVATLSEFERRQYSYYLQEGRAGLDEAFAEAVPAMNDGVGTDYFEQDFSNLVAYVNANLGAYRAAGQRCLC